MGWAQPIFFCRTDFADNGRSTMDLSLNCCERTLPAAGVRAGRLGDVSQGPARARVHRQAGRRRRRGLRAGEQPPDAAVRGREHRLRPPRGVVAGPRPAAARSRPITCASRAQEARAAAARARATARAAEGHRCAAATDGSVLVETATGAQAIAVRRHRPGAPGAEDRVEKS